MDHPRTHTTASDGFTLVEILIAMAISSLVISAIYTTFTKQQQLYTAQDQTVEAQQNIRAAVDLMSRQIRMAGYDPTTNAAAGFRSNVSFSNGGGLTTPILTNSTQISFTADLDEDGTIDQIPEDINGDGNNDLTEMEQISFRLNGTNLQMYSTRTGAITWQTVADNIANLELNYRDANYAVTATLADIRIVQLTILTVSGRSDPDFTDSQTYTTASGAVWGPFNDHFHRRFLTEAILCRNMGL